MEKSSWFYNIILILKMKISVWEVRTEWLSSLRSGSSGLSRLEYAQESGIQCESFEGL